MKRRSLLKGTGAAIGSAFIVSSARFQERGSPSDTDEDVTIIDEESDIEGDVYYVSPAGDDSDSGTEERPYRTLERAATDVGPGDAVFLQGGAYERDEEVEITGLSGTADRPITITGYPDPVAEPVFMFDGSPSEWDIAGGLHFSDIEHVTVRNITVRESPYFGVVLSGESADNRFERVSTFNNGLGGFTLEDESSRTLLEDCVARDCMFDGFRVHVETGRDNLFRRCESSGHTDGDGNADGFNVTQSYLPGVADFERCVAHHCEDDGFDLWGGIDCTIDHCLAYRIGYNEDGDQIASNLAGNGFKLSGEDALPGDDTGYGNNLYRSATWGCYRIGVTCNENEKSPHQIYNVTSVGNEVNYWVGYDQPDDVRNCISYAAEREDLIEDGTDDQSNTWNLNISDPEFVTMDPYDGQFLNLSEDSPCIEAGTTDVNFQYCGNAPDLGLYEYSDGEQCDTGLEAVGRVGPREL